jgi:hypothetical protein
MLLRKLFYGSTRTAEVRSAAHGPGAPAKR